MIKKIIVLFGICLLISSCAAVDRPTTDVRVVSSMSYPVLPDLKPVPDPNLLAWKHDIPRDMKKLVVKNSASCKSVPESEQDSDFWDRCGIHPPLEDTNIFIGFDQDNWNIILENFAKLRENIFLYKSRVDEVNAQRKEWREKADTEENKVLEDSAKTRKESDAKNKKEEGSGWSIF